MIRAVSFVNRHKGKPFILGGLFAFFTENKDNIIRPKFDSPEYNNYLKSETGWQRLKDMYSISEYGEMSMELSSIIQATTTAGLIGLCIGGFNKSKFSYNDFMKNNEASVFRSNFDAKKKLHDQVFLAFGKGGFQVGWRLAVFTACFYGISTTISAYRGKSSILEYSAGGAIAGFIYKIPIGYRAGFVGMALGGALGTLAGGMTMLILRCTGTTLEEMRYWQHKYKELRPENKPVKKTDDEDDPTTPLLANRMSIVDISSKLDKDLESIERPVNTPSK